MWQGAGVHQLECGSPSIASGLLRAARPCLRPSSSQLTTCSQASVSNQLVHCLGMLSQRSGVQQSKVSARMEVVCIDQLLHFLCTCCLPVCLLGLIHASRHCCCNLGSPICACLKSSARTQHLKPFQCRYSRPSPFIKQPYSAASCVLVAVLTQHLARPVLYSNSVHVCSFPGRARAGYACVTSSPTEQQAPPHQRARGQHPGAMKTHSTQGTTKAADSLSQRTRQHPWQNELHMPQEQARPLIQP